MDQTASNLSFSISENETISCDSCRFEENGAKVVRRRQHCCPNRDECDDDYVTIQRIRIFHVTASILLFVLLLSLSTLPLVEPSTSRTTESQSSETKEQQQQHQADDNDRLISAASPFRIVIDAGSTGSRLHIFEMVSSSSTTSTTTRIECLRRGSSKAWTPLSAFAPSSHHSHYDGEQRHNEGNSQHHQERLNSTHVAHHMLPLFDYASMIIPQQYHSTTPVRIAATAGMRLLSLREQELVYDALYDGLLEQSAITSSTTTSHHGQLFTFVNLKRDNIMTLDGEREAYFGAVAANYLQGVIDAELRVIVPPDDDDQEEEVAQKQQQQQQESQTNVNEKGICTNKFKMCEQDAEDIVFGPSKHYVSQQQQRHDVRTHGPLGALDMGGSSTQIVYRRNIITSYREEDGDINSKSNLQPGSSALSSSSDSNYGDNNNYDIPSHLNDDEFFSTSYLSYGADQFRERLWDLWVSEATKQRQEEDAKEEEGNHSQPSPPIILNPCSFVGYEMEYKGYLLRGTGDAILCSEQINRLIPHHDNVIDLDELFDENLETAHKQTAVTEGQKTQPETKKNIVGGVEHPPIKGKFYGMSLYFFTLDCLRELSDPDHPIHLSWPTPSIEELTHALDGFCSRKWQGDLEEVQHEAHEHTRAEVLPHRCVEAVYMVTLLRDGFGFHPSSRDITFTQWVDGNEVEWSLGMALSEFARERRQKEEKD